MKWLFKHLWAGTLQNIIGTCNYEYFIYPLRCWRRSFLITLTCHQPFLPSLRSMGLQWMDGGKEKGWVRQGVLSPGCGRESDEPWLYPTGIKGSTVRPKHHPLLSPLLSSPLLFSPLLLIWSGIHSLLFAILMKIRHLALPTFAPLCRSLPQQQGEKDKEEKRQREKRVRWREREKARIRRGILCYCWPSRLDCQMAQRGWKMVSFILGYYDRGLLTQWKNHKMMLAVRLVRGPNHPHGRSNTGVILASVIYVGERGQSF